MLISLVCILRPRVGGRATADVMIQALWGIIDFVLVLATLGLASVPLGSAAALSLALAIITGLERRCAGIETVVVDRRRRREMKAASIENDHRAQRTG